MYQKAMGTTLKRKLHTRHTQDYTLKILLFTHINKGNEENKKNELIEEERTKFREYLTKKIPSSSYVLRRTLECFYGFGQLLCRG